MNILITGGTGFLGSHLCHRLVRDGHSLTVLRRASSKATPLADLDVRHEVGDVMDVDSMGRAVKGQQVVVHAAAGVVGSGAHERSYDVNVEGTRNVVEACLRHGVGRLLHVSSAAAIGIPRSATPADENFPFNLLGSRLYYHVSKYRGERAVADAAARGLDAVIVNPASIWGPFGSSYRGSDMVQRTRVARVVRTSPGGICIVHVHDVVDGIVAALQHGVSGERYILGGDNLTFHQWITMIAREVGARPLVVPLPGLATKLVTGVLRSLSAIDQRFHGPYLRSYFAGHYAFYDSAKARKDLGYKPRGFARIVTECANFIAAAAR